ncbi:hypothetical protein [Candidatus Merdisoma sp. JLR.KK006]|uniref:hypothetical protein n=1 Tax=Candidatus Merdisoma sp. JLR.KK006 TaxID=3112626 RepID=UPI002FEF2F96
MGFEGNEGSNKLANVLRDRMQKESESPLVLDFGGIQADGSLVTNTFPVPIPKGDYSILRQLTLGKAGDILTATSGDDGEHGGHTGGNGVHSHDILLPEKMRSVASGDRVLVAWVNNEAVVIDIVTRS